jgi:hypothetical protein
MGHVFYHVGLHPALMGHDRAVSSAFTMHVAVMMASACPL